MGTKTHLLQVQRRRIERVGIRDNRRLESEHWIIDSGCSHHMTGRKELFKDLKKLDQRRNVNFGNNTKGRIIAEGNIGTRPSIRDVYLVECISYNLISVSQLTDQGYDILFR